MKSAMFSIGQADFRDPQHQHVAGEPQRCHADQHADAAEAEEQQRLVVAFAAAAVAEAPFPVEDVGRDHRDDAGDDLGRHGLGLQHRELERVEDRRVDDEGGRADDRELDQLVVPLEVRPDRPGSRAIVASVKDTTAQSTEIRQATCTRAGRGR